MRKCLVVIVLYILTIRVYSQCSYTVYVRDLGKYGKVESSQREKGEAINKVISFYNEQTYNYRRWKRYYVNGEPKEEVFITLESAGRSPISEPGYNPKPYTEKRVGKWLFWDERGNQTVMVY